MPVTVTLTASYARTLFLVCAAYDEDGRMLSCADATITCPDPAAAQIVLPGSCADADSIRVFLLNDSDTYRPVADSIAAVKSS